MPTLPSLSLPSREGRVSPLRLEHPQRPLCPLWLQAPCPAGPGESVGTSQGLYVAVFDAVGREYLAFVLGCGTELLKLL